jgi:hypothetical protein
MLPVNLPVIGNTIFQPDRAFGLQLGNPVEAPGPPSFAAPQLNDKLFWSNGAVWDNLDLDLLNALFEMGTGYP